MHGGALFLCAPTAADQLLHIGLLLVQQPQQVCRIVFVLLHLEPILGDCQVVKRVVAGAHEVQKPAKRPNVHLDCGTEGSLAVVQHQLHRAVLCSTASWFR